MATIHEAIIIAGPEDGSRTVAGVPLLLRTILTVQRAGVERCLVVGGARLPSDPRVRCAVSSTPTLAPPPDDGLRLLVGSDAVLDTALVRHLVEHARADEALEVEADGVRVRIAPGPLLLGNGGRAPLPATGVLCAASLPAADIERRMLRGLENRHDGYIDRLVYRRFSRHLTRVLLRTGLSPNAVTLVGIAIGVAGGLLLGRPGVGATVAAVLLLVASGVFDCSDGELARLLFAESRFGHWLDLTGDTVVHVALLGGVARRLAVTGGMPSWWALALLGVGVLGAFAVITWSEETETRRQRVTAWENGILDNVLGPLTTRDWYVFVVAFAVVGRLDLLVPAAAVGAQAFWVGTLVLLLRVLRRT